MWVIGSLLSELEVSPSALLEAINQVGVEEGCPNPFLMKTLQFCVEVLERSKRKGSLVSVRMLLASGWFASTPISASLLASAAKSIPRNDKNWSTRCLSNLSIMSSWNSMARKSEQDAAMLLVKMGVARRANIKKREGYWIHLHPIMQAFAKRKGGLQSAKAAVEAVIRKMGNTNNMNINTYVNTDQLWASAFLVFGFKSEPPLVQLNPTDMVLYVRTTALPLAFQAFTTFSRCNSAMELLKVCTNALEEVEKSFVSQVQQQDYWSHHSICWKPRLQIQDEYVWQDVTLLKATLLESRAKLLARGGHLDSAKELCRTCISIRTVMLGHNHAHTLAAQDTLATLVRMRSKI